MSKTPFIILAVAVAAVLALVALSGVFGGGGSEVNYTVVIRLSTPQGAYGGAIAWMLVGYGQGDGYIVMGFPGMPMRFYLATEQGTPYAAMCSADVCARLTNVPLSDTSVRLIDWSKAKATELGGCTHLGRPGRLVKVNLPLSSSLLGNLIASSGAARLPGSNADAYVCESGGVPLWINITSTIEAAGAKYTAEYKLIAVSVGPFNANTYQEALKKAKG
ncbi:MAG: hypothetical protein ABWK05_08680 [Pyrobaculum sp.]